MQKRKISSIELLSKISYLRFNGKILIMLIALKKLIKENPWTFFFGLITVVIAFRGEFFYIFAFVYYLLIRLLLSDKLDIDLRKTIKKSLWILLVVVGILTFYVNNYLPKGPFISTGDVVCMNDGRGPCEETSVEDTRNLNIPDWAKFLKNNGIHLIMSILFLAIVSSRDRDKI